MKTLPLSTAKAQLSELLDEIEDFEVIQLTRNGRTAAVLVNPLEWEGLQETLEILADEELMAQLRASRRSKKRYSMEQVFKDLLK